MNNSIFSMSGIAGLAFAGLMAGACAHSTHTKTRPIASARSSGSEPAGPSADAVNRATPMNCNSAVVFFNSGSDQLDPAAQARLDEVGRCMSSASSRELTVIGRADPRGTAMDNQALGQRRATAVADYLRTRGVPNAQVTVRSEGAENATNDRTLYPYERNANVVIQPRQ